MSSPVVDVRVGGQTYRVVATSDASALQRYAALIDDRLRDLGPSTALHPKSLVLVALALAHELEQERERRKDVEQRARETLQGFLTRIDAALDSVDENGEPLPPLPAHHSSP